jgi:hypothetical protein
MKKQLLGFVLMVVVAFVFMTVYQTVKYSLYTDEYTLILWMGHWDVPSQMLESTLQILAIIGIAWVSVGVWLSDPTAPRWFWGFVTTLVFILLFRLSNPLIGWLANGEGLFTTTPWVNSFTGCLKRCELFAFVPASWLVIGSELLRRQIVGSSSVASPKVGGEEVAPTTELETRLRGDEDDGWD